MNNFKCYLFDDSPAIWGYPPLELVGLADLMPGDKIKKMGVPGCNGIETSDNRVHKYEPPICYAGQIKANLIKPGLHDENTTYAAFTVPDHLVPKDLFSPQGSVYLLFIITPYGYLWRETIKNQTIWPYKMIFERA